MKRCKVNIAPGKQNNRGFSLVELIISIAILAIVMIPLMSNFFRSMQMNKKAEAIQIQSNVAANIMESLKTLTMTEILTQFSPSGSFSIIDHTGEVMRLDIDISGEYVEYPEALSMEEQATYYLAIHGVSDGGTAYDTLITINSLPYNITGTMNDYPMPDVINLDKKANSLIQSNMDTSSGTIDGDAMNIFLARGAAYANKLYYQSPSYLTYLRDKEEWKDECEEYAMGGPEPSPEPMEPPFNPTDYPDYLDSTNIKSLITKSLKVTVNKKTIDYKIEYYCNWVPIDIEKNLLLPVSTQQYPKDIENIYMFYNPSQYLTGSKPDIIEIENEDPTLPVNFYVARQGNGAAMQNLKIVRNSESDNVKVYTNLTNTEVKVETGGSIDNYIQELLKSEKQDRIYNITVDICEYVPYVSGDLSNNYKKILYTLKSSKEE